MCMYACKYVNMLIHSMLIINMLTIKICNTSSHIVMLTSLALKTSMFNGVLVVRMLISNTLVVSMFNISLLIINMLVLIMLTNLFNIIMTSPEC